MGFHLTPTGHLLDFYPTPAKPLLNFWGTSTGLLSDLFLTLSWNSCPRAHAHAQTHTHTNTNTNTNTQTQTQTHTHTHTHIGQPTGSPRLTNPMITSSSVSFTFSGQFTCCKLRVTKILTSSGNCKPTAVPHELTHSWSCLLHCVNIVSKVFLVTSPSWVIA